MAQLYTTESDTSQASPGVRVDFNDGTTDTVTEANSYRVDAQSNMLRVGMDIQKTLTDYPSFRTTVTYRWDTVKSVRVL